jgi:hypothetical protein
MFRKLSRYVRRRPVAIRSWSRSAHLYLESLEERAVPASVFLVPLTTATDSAHFHTLAAAQTAAGAGGLITIEPGSQPESSVAITQSGLTIRGDPNISGSTLLPFDAQVQANNVSLTNLHLGSVTLSANVNHTILVGSLVRDITDPGSTANSGQFFINQNMITGTISLAGNSGGANTADNVSDNTISGPGPAVLTLTNADNTQILNNHFIVPLDNSVHEVVIHSNSQGVIVANNLFELAAGAANPVFMQVQNTGGAGDQLSITIRNNVFRGGGSAGIGLDLDVTPDPSHFTARIEGNDFNGLNLGVRIFGAGTSAGDNAQGNIDLGGGSTTLGASLGGNNFHGYTGLDVAIMLQNTPNNAGNVIFAQRNIFPNGVSPGLFIRDATHGSGTGAILATSLDANHSYVQALYNDLLGRTGQLSELDPWVVVLNNPAQGRSALVNGILRSSESLGRIVDRLYLRYLGRASDPGGRAAFISLLQNGTSLEDVEAMFVSSPEYLTRITSDYVQSLYINLLGRTGSQSELVPWYNALGQLGLLGVAKSFTHAFEHRLNFARTLYQQFLHRTPSNAEISPLASSGTDLLGMEVFVLTSDEFSNRG